ncbi:MAG: hypothetical protein H6Q69_3432 [Firmicutes bacterium]|nr:hypothetical protein [Bacillota bacterium]
MDNGPSAMSRSWEGWAIMERKSELLELWERDLSDIKDTVPNWQAARVKLVPFNFHWSQIFWLFNDHVCVSSYFLEYRIYIPKHLRDMDSKFRKVCLSHEYGHVVEYHCLIYGLLFKLGLPLFLLGIALKTYFGAIIGLFGLGLIVLAFLYDGIYKVDEKEFEADDVAVTATDKEKVLLWLINLSERKKVSKESRETLRKRIERLGGLVKSI